MRDEAGSVTPSDDEAIAALIRERDANDTGERLSLDELFREHGVDRAEVEAAIAHEAAVAPGDAS